VAQAYSGLVAADKPPQSFSAERSRTAAFLRNATGGGRRAEIPAISTLKRSK
jgi:hypothetical protein